MNHMKETQIPLILYRWRGGYYKTDAEAVDAIISVVRESVEKITKYDTLGCCDSGGDDYGCYCSGDDRMTEYAQGEWMKVNDLLSRLKGEEA